MKCRFCGSECDWNEDVCSCCFSSIHENFIPNEARFPREDIEKCINKDNLWEIDKKCPICGKNMIHIYFESPKETWKLMCGRAGDLDVCTECQR